MDYGHGGIFNFCYSHLSNPCNALRNSFRKLLYLFLATSQTRLLANSLTRKLECLRLAFKRSSMSNFGKISVLGCPRAPMTTRLCILTDQKHYLIVTIVDYCIVRAEPPLINGWWSHLASGRVNVRVLAFCKFGITKALIGPRNTATYQINTGELKFWVRFDPEAIISL